MNRLTEDRQSRRGKSGSRLAYTVKLRQDVPNSDCPAFHHQFADGTFMVFSAANFLITERAWRTSPAASKYRETEGQYPPDS